MAAHPEKMISMPAISPHKLILCRHVPDLDFFVKMVSWCGFFLAGLFSPAGRS
jgi:hypothetical protein